MQAEDERTRVYALTIGEVDTAIEEALMYFSTMTEASSLELLRAELDHLVESKHLLVIQNIDQILKRLAEALRLAA